MPSYTSSKEWILAFDMAAVECLATRPGVQEPNRYRLEARACIRHGPSCVAVTYGDVVDHFPWAQTDPTALAEKLLGTMLPKTDGPSG